jgi:hypothetical protein
LTRSDNSTEERRKAFVRAQTTVQRRIELFVSLPHGKLDALAPRRHLADIGRSEAPARTA